MASKGDSRYHEEWDMPGSPSDDDPDYREDSAGEEDEDELPKTMGRDRARWLEDNLDAVSEIYRNFKRDGNLCFGRSFFQCGDITKFAHFCYKYTALGAAK